MKNANSRLDHIVAKYNYKRDKPQSTSENRGKVTKSNNAVFIKELRKRPTIMKREDQSIDQNSRESSKESKMKQVDVTG